MAKAKTNDEGVLKAKSFKALGKKIYNAYKPATKYSPELLSEFKSPALAAELAGTSDKKSNEYKAALRNIQRYKQGSRSPQEKTKKAIERAVKSLRKDTPIKFPAGKITATGIHGYSDERRKRTTFVNMTGSIVGEFVELARDPDDEEGESPEQFYFEMYDAPGMFFVSGTITFEEIK